MSSKLEKARASMGRLRSRVKQAEPVRALSAVGAGAAVGALERKGTLPTTMAGVPAKPLIAAGLHFVASRSSVGGATHSVLAGAANGIEGAYGYAAGKAGTLIAGEDESEDFQD